MRRTCIALPVITIAAILIAVAIVPPRSLAQRPDAPPYAERGPFPVGTREFTIEDEERPLDVTVWYPAVNPDDLEEVTEYRVLIYSLDGRALRDAEPDSANGPYPLVMFSHGSSGLRYQSLFLTEHLASYGFVVVAADHPGNTLFDAILDSDNFVDNMVDNFALRPLDVLRQIDFMDELAGPGAIFDGVVDMQRIAVSGHSFGGYTALSVGGAQLDFDTFDAWCANPPDFNQDLEPFGVRPLLDDQVADIVEQTCWLQDRTDRMAELRGLDAPPDGLWPATTDPRIRAVVLMAPWNAPLFGETGMASVTAPTLILVGSDDGATYPQRDAVPIFRAVNSASKALVIFDNADHYIFVDECPDEILAFGLYDMCSDPVWDMDRVHDLINHYATAFLRAHLYDDAEASAALQAGTDAFRAVTVTTAGPQE